MHRASLEHVDRPSPSDSIWQPPSTFDVVVDRVFRGGTLALAWSAVLVVVLVVGRIARSAAPAMQAYGTQFLIGTVWDPNRQVFGILPQITGTLYTSFLGLAIGGVFGIAIAIFLSEGLLSSVVDSLLKRFGRAERPFLSSLPAQMEAA